MVFVTENIGPLDLQKFTQKANYRYNYIPLPAINKADEFLTMIQRPQEKEQKEGITT